MTINKFYELLCEAGNIQVVYSGYEGDIKEPPFIVYAMPSDDDFCADNIHYAEICNGWLELYTTNYSRIFQRKIIDFFNLHKIPYEKENETYIESQALHLSRFSFQLIIESEEE